MPTSPRLRKLEANHPAFQRIRWMSQVLDNAIPIPGTGYRVGIDPLLGLFPGAGDVVSTVFSVYIVLESLRFGLPKETLTRMVYNLLADTAIGSVPVAGDVFDVAWKANARNLKLLEAHLQNPQPSRPADRTFIAVVVVILLLLVVAVAAIAFGLIRLLAWIFTGS